MELISKKIVIISFLLPVVGYRWQKRTTVYPKENFSVVQGKLSDGKPFIGSVNMAYQSYTEKGNYPWCLEISIALNSSGVYENGLPRQSESNIVNKFESKLLEYLKEVATVHYVAHIYNDNFLDTYMYLDNPEQANNYLKQVVNNEGITRPFSYKISKDSEWLTVQRLLRQ
jgi:type IV secretory pathway TrbF-like protein